MTKYDIKNYLEKIYKVPVAGVKTVNKMGKTYNNAYKGYLVKDEDYKIAFVTLPPGKSKNFKHWHLCIFGKKFFATTGERLFKFYHILKKYSTLIQEQILYSSYSDRLLLK